MIQTGSEQAQGHSKSGAVMPAARRKKTTRRSVIIADKLADRTITIGGILVIIAVLTIMVFLFQ